MKNDFWLDAVSNIDYELIERAMITEIYLERKKKARTKVYLSALAACLALVLITFPVLKLLEKPEAPKYEPVLVTYSTLAELDEALGFETLLSNPELLLLGVRVLYETNDGETADTSHPISLSTVSWVSDKGMGDKTVLYNIMFGLESVSELKNTGYDELKNTIEIDGIPIYTATKDAGPFNTELAAFEYNGLIYTVEMPIKENGITMEEHIKYLMI